MKKRRAALLFLSILLCGGSLLAQTRSATDNVCMNGCI